MKIKFQSWTLPLAVFIVLLLSFGVMIPLLGLYWDDWPVVVNARLKGLWSFWEFYKGERPFSAWTYMITIPWLGTKPIVWHVFTLFLRWLTVVAMWWTLRGMWPKRSREIGWICLIFAIYPVFTNQSVAVAFNQHWMLFLLYCLSIGLMIQAIRKPRYYWLFTILALIAEILHVLTMEYFWGLELIRPLVLWIILSEQNLSRREQFKKILLHWSPYLVVLTIGLVLRMTIFVDLSNDPNRPDLLYSLKDQPILTMTRLAQLAIQDLINNLLTTWYGTITPLDINLKDGFYLFSLLVTVMVAGLAYFYLSHFMREHNLEADERKKWINQALLFGMVCVFLGSLPVWVTDRQALLGLYGGRFGLAAEFGLSIVLFALLEWFTVKPLPKIILVSALIGLAAGYHTRIAALYHESSLRQNRFYWELSWRAPYIKPDTAILSADELFIYVGRNATALALNLLYPKQEGADTDGYWFVEFDHDLSRKTLPKLASGVTFSRSFRNFSFRGDSRDSLVIDYQSGSPRCLWVLTPDDFDNIEIPELTREVVSASNLSRIEGIAKSLAYPPRDIFGKEPEHGWCYYFQKADLARQLGQWEEVARLGDEAREAGTSTQFGFELLPFIQGYAHTQQWDRAVELTDHAFELNPLLGPRLCRVWDEILKQSTPPIDTIKNIDDLKIRLGCSAN